MAFGSESLSLPEGVFTILRDLIRERTGLHFESARWEILAEKLSPRALECGFSSLLDYYYLLKYGPGAEDEWPQVMDALSVPETYFWREMDQVRVLVDVLVPQYALAHPGKVIEIWCAACATGEEPLTIAMALEEAGWLERAPVRIWASDASPSAIARARLGRYRDRSFRALPPAASIASEMWLKVRSSSPIFLLVPPSWLTTRRHSYVRHLFLPKCVYLF